MSNPNLTISQSYNATVLQVDRLLQDIAALVPAYNRMKNTESFDPIRNTLRNKVYTLCDLLNAAGKNFPNQNLFV